jgi:hypothetical protein
MCRGGETPASPLDANTSPDTDHAPGMDEEQPSRSTRTRSLRTERRSAYSASSWPIYQRSIWPNALEWTRTTTGREAHKALNLAHARKMLPGASGSSKQRGFADASNASGGASVATMLPRRIARGACRSMFPFVSCSDPAQGRRDRASTFTSTHRGSHQPCRNRGDRRGAALRRCRLILGAGADRASTQRHQPVLAVAP